MSEEPIEITAIPCPNCGHPIPIGQTYCEGCGIGDPSSTKNPPVTIHYQPPQSDPETPIADLPPTMSPPPSGEATHRCPNCGRTIPNGTTYCASCGSGSRPSYGAPAAKQGTPVWVWVLVAILASPFLCCGACFLMSFIDSMGRRQ